MKKYLAVILSCLLLLCTLLMSCKNQTKSQEPTSPSTATTEQVLDGTADYSQLETTGQSSETTRPESETVTVPTQTQPTKPTQNSTATEGSTTPTETEPTVGPSSGPTDPVPPATDPDGYFNQVVRP